MLTSHLGHAEDVHSQCTVTTQVIERHVVRGLEKIFSPVVVNALTDAEAEAIASEPAAAKRRREYLEDQIRRLTAGHEIFKSVL
jgi:hypothetical protein